MLREVIFCRNVDVRLQIIVVYSLNDHGSIDFLDHYSPVALPVQCLYYLLLVICTVSVCDRYICVDGGLSFDPGGGDNSTSCGQISCQGARN